jgi:glycosyltransferase involved in cell wall biosynthesis
MNNLVFSTGIYDVSVPGAIRVITKNLFFESPNNLAGAVIGVGKLSDYNNLTNNFHQINILPILRRKTTLLRLLSRVKKFIDYRKPNPILLKILFEIEQETHKIADLLATQALDKLISDNVPIEAVMGLTGLSLNLAELAKKNDIKFGLITQFSHPNFQNKQLEEGYKELNFEPPIISEKQIERHLVSLEIADFIWSPSEFARESYINNGVAKEKIFSINNGIDVKKFKRSLTKKKPNDFFTILFVGNVGIQKGINILLEAVKLTNFSYVKIIFNGKADEYANLIIEDYKELFKTKKNRNYFRPR